MNEDYRSTPAWKLPQGVNSSLWHYAHEPRLAEDEDEYFRDHPLFRADARALDARFVRPGRLADLGCGAGRLSLHFAEKGFPVVAVDLSQPMLDRVARKAEASGSSLNTIQANLCQLGCFPENAFAYALLMFSTLGMVRGAAARRKTLAEAFRILEPGGQLAIHAHNFWLNLRDSQGRHWLFHQAWLALRGDASLGDRSMTYRGIAAMQVHLYRWGELRADITAAGFQIEQILPIDAITAQTIPLPRLLHRYRAGGWIVFAKKPRIARS